jgi:hypothetical protein
MTPMNDALNAQQSRLRQAIVGAGDSVDNLLCERPGGSLLRIYRDAYRGRLLDALRNNFEVLARVMGDDAFESLGLGYLAAQPSKNPSIRWFGHHLVAFMDSDLQSDGDLVKHPALVDLAAMEWALRAAFDAADAALLQFADLASVAADDWPSITFTLHPAVHCLRLQWAIEPIWLAVQSSAPDDDELQLPEPMEQAHHLLIWREGYETRWMALDNGEAALLEAAQQSASFGDLCELAATQMEPEHAAPFVATCLRSWVDRGLLAA